MIILLHWGFQDGAFTDWPASSPSLSGVTSRRSTGSFSKVGGFPTHFLAQNSDGARFFLGGRTRSDDQLKTPSFSPKSWYFGGHCGCRPLWDVASFRWNFFRTK